MNNQIEIIDDFLPHNEFCQLFDVIMNQFEWGWVDGIATLDDGHFQLVHGMYVNNVPTSKFFQILSPIYDREQIVSTFRIKANLTPRTEKLKVFTDAFHEDMGDHASKCTTGIYYINTNNGYTLFEKCGTKVESVANRFVRFPGNLRHTGTTCTDENRRVVINFNYIN